MPNTTGDTPDSYAYDGNRQRKWNVATYRYGAVWQSGDIISCTIDLDAGVVEFYRYALFIPSLQLRVTLHLKTGD